jgi:hypothetical protein
MAAAVIALLGAKVSRKALTPPKSTTPAAPVTQVEPKPSEESLAQAEARAATEGQAAGEKRSKQAAASLAGRNAQGFGTNPNKAKPFLLSL